MCCATDGVPGWRFSALSNSTEHYLLASLLWYRCHWSLYVWHVPLTETHLHWHLCHWHLNGGQWSAYLFYFISSLIHLLWSHLVLSKEPESGRKRGKPSRPVAPTSLLLSSLFPVFSCLQDLLRHSLLTNHWVCFVQSYPHAEPFIF